MIHKNLIFKVERCNNERRLSLNKSACFNETEIDNFVYDLEITNWVKQEQMDFKAFGKKPIIKVQVNTGRILLDVTKKHSVNTYLQFNELETEDSPIIPGK